jgi:hypothetical protein
MNVIMSSPSPATEPRRPQQARSRERVQRMLDAADHILAVVSYPPTRVGLAGMVTSTISSPSELFEM